MTVSDKVSVQYSQQEMPGLIAAAEALPGGANRVRALLGLPVKPADPLAESHGKALVRAADTALKEGDRPAARNAFHAAALRLPADDRAEIYATNHFAVLAADTRSSDRRTALWGSIVDVIGTPHGSQRLINAVQWNFQRNFELSAKDDLADTLDRTIKGAQYADMGGASPQLVKYMTQKVAGQLDMYAQTDPEGAERFVVRLGRIPQPELREQRQDQAVLSRLAVQAVGPRPKVTRRQPRR